HSQLDFHSTREHDDHADGESWGDRRIHLWRIQLQNYARHHHQHRWRSIDGHIFPNRPQSVRSRSKLPWSAVHSLRRKQWQMQRVPSDVLRARLQYGNLSARLKLGQPESYSPAAQCESRVTGCARSALSSTSGTPVL